MKRELVRPPGFWKTVGLLLRAARARSGGRRERQAQLLQNKTGKSQPSVLGSLAILGVIVMALLVHVMAAVLVYVGVRDCQRYAMERDGKIVVSSGLLTRLENRGPADASDLRKVIESEAKRRVEHYGGRQKEAEDLLWTEIRNNGGARFVTEDDAASGLQRLSGWTGMPQMAGSLLLLLWLVMLICQGEGMELDLQRRRHPMWEWLLSHPIQPAAAFLAEMAAPLSANPMYWCGPVFVGVLYGMAYGPVPGIWAAVLAGVPVTVGAACLGKAIEIGIMIRFAPRSRSGILGLMSWMGYAVLLFSFMGIYIVPRLVGAAGGFLSLFGSLPWPWLGLFLGGGAGGGYHYMAGLAFCWTLAVSMAVAGVSFSLWGAQSGLSGNLSPNEARVRRGNGEPVSFRRDPLYRKEFLWFLRDRGAIVQAILIPITAAAWQIFNMRGLLEKAQGEWNYLCGAAICFGTYFLWVLGPRSLTSEGAALWIPLTWPKGLESLLKAKAWLWAMISTGLVTLAMLYAAMLYPRDLWKIALVLAAWFLFARSMAEKSVTLVTAASSSGEMQKIPAGRRWATQMGMLTFSIGVITQQWHLAIVGIVFSYMTAAAMWQNFRARLPYLYDPWSEQLPSPPTLMHAMVSISVMVEMTAILTAVIAAVGGGNNLGLAMLFGYGISSILVCLGTMHFLSNHNVPSGQIWSWLPGELAEAPVHNTGSILFAEYKQKPKLTAQSLIAGLQEMLPLISLGAVAGLALGVLAHGYTFVLRQIPSIRELLEESAKQMGQHADARVAYGILAVCFAPFAEEYLFRGLLFRALDREFGDWRAVLWSALFFTIYHPVLAWIPVFSVGVLNALLFKKSGKLLPAVAAHMAYNLVIAAW